MNTAERVPMKALRILGRILPVLLLLCATKAGEVQVFL